MSLPSRFASAAPNAGQTPGLLLVLYPKPASPSDAGAALPSFELLRHVAYRASSGRMSVAAALTDTGLPPVNRPLTDAGGVVSEELSPHRVELIRLPGAGKVVMLMVQWGCAK